MRDIEFRGWKIDTKEWLYGSLINNAFPKNDKEYRMYIFDNTVDIAYDCFEIIVLLIKDLEVNPETVGQYTGLKDKNGKKIFEGDITEQGWIVEKDKGCFWLVDPITSFLVDFLYMLNDGIKIIGNIHETPKAEGKK